MDAATSDWELLNRFARNRDEAAFRELVERHIDLVHGTARRSLGNGHPQLDDAVQAAFVLLARKAAKVPRRGALAGWLFRVTRYCCANVLKTERRRRMREREVSGMRHEAAAAETGAELVPLLDEGLSRLGEGERQVVLLHYLERMPAAETARQLGISRDAAEKRVERGLRKLREFFKGRGQVVPLAAVAALFTAEAAKAAPPGLAARIVAAKAAAAGTAAGTIAEGVLQMMRLIRLKLALAITVAAACVGVITATMTMSEGSQAAIAPPSAAGPRQPMMVRWDLVMNEAGMKRVITGLESVKTQSVGYDAYTGTAAQVRDAVDRAREASEVLIPPSRLGWASMNDTPPRDSDFGLESHWVSGAVRVDPESRTQVVVNMNGTGPIRAKTVNGGVHLDFEGAMHEATALISDGSPMITKKVRMNYVGDVAVGHAVVIAGLLAEKSGVQLWHVAVLETLAATSQEYSYVRRNTAAQWIADGAESALANADRALAWAKTGKPLGNSVAGFEKKLGNGAIVRLAALSRQAKWPDCWWDPAGKAVAWDSNWDFGHSHEEAGGLQVAVTAEDPSIPDVEKSTPGMVVIRSGFGGPRKVLSTASFDDSGVLEVGVAAGPWKDAGAIAKGHEVPLPGGAVKLESLVPGLRKNGNMPGNTWVTYSGHLPADIQVLLVAKDKLGKEIKPQGGAEPPEILFGRKNADHTGEMTGMIDGDIDDLATFVVRWRPREWVTFEQFAANPATLPGQKVAASPASSTAAGPVAGTPEAFQHEMQAAAASGDAKKLRALMFAKEGDAARYADAQADAIAAQSALRNAAEAKFGKDAAEQAMGQLLPHMDESLITGWKVEGDRATPIYKETNVVIVGGEMALRRVDGKWKMEVALPEPFTAEMKKQFEEALPQQAAQSAAFRKLAGDIAAGKFKDAYEARDALLKLREGH